MDALDRLFRLTGFFVNGWYRLLGDASPDFCGVCRQFTTAWAAEFNRQNPDAPGVLYQSSGAMAGARSDVFMWWSNLIIGWVEGENDGLVTVESARWANFGGVWRGAGKRGLSHLDEVDFRRRPLKRRGETVDPAERSPRWWKGCGNRGFSRSEHHWDEKSLRRIGMKPPQGDAVKGSLFSVGQISAEDRLLGRETAGQPPETIVPQRFPEIVIS